MAPTYSTGGRIIPGSFYLTCRQGTNVLLSPNFAFRLPTRNAITLRCQVSPPCLLILRFLSNPPDLIRNPRLLFLAKSTFFYKAPILFPFFVCTIYAQVHGKIVCFCICFSFMLHDNRLLFFPSLYSHLKPFLNFRPPFILATPLFIRFRNFSRPPVYWNLPFFVTSESIFSYVIMAALKLQSLPKVVGTQRPPAIAGVIFLLRNSFSSDSSWVQSIAPSPQSNVVFEDKTLLWRIYGQFTSEWSDTTL